MTFVNDAFALNDNDTDDEKQKLVDDESDADSEEFPPGYSEALTKEREAVFGYKTNRVMLGVTGNKNPRINILNNEFSELYPDLL